MMSVKLKDVSTHFAFGENWASYAELLTEEHIQGSVDGLRRLLGAEIPGRTFLDIGSGSGVHSLAALRLGAADVLATDIDADSVATTRRTLSRFAPSEPWRGEQMSVFEMSPTREGTFDIVYSWGVLHHTGSMFEAITRAAAMVSSRGYLCVALYQRTPLCSAWTVEKRLYSSSPAWMQWVMRKGYCWAYRTYSNLVSLRGPGSDKAVLDRGMNAEHDAHDWLGGYPYESISREAAHAFIEGLGFRPVREFLVEPGIGLFGTGCDEYVFQRVD